MLGIGDSQQELSYLNSNLFQQPGWYPVRPCGLPWFEVLKELDDSRT